MANPQVEAGYTRIANELMEQLPRFKFNGTQFRIIIAILRYTYGFGRKDHELSLSFLSQATGTDRKQIERELRALIESRVVNVEAEATYTKSRKLGLNKDYEQWLVERCQLISRQSTKKQTVSKLEDTVSAKKQTGGVSGLGDQERKSFKENSKESYNRSSFKSKRERYQEQMELLRKFHEEEDRPLELE